MGRPARLDGETVVTTTRSPRAASGMDALKQNVTAPARPAGANLYDAHMAEDELARGALALQARRRHGARCRSQIAPADVGHPGRHPRPRPHPALLAGTPR